VEPSLLHRLSPTNFVLLMFYLGEVSLQSKNKMQLNSQASALGLYGDQWFPSWEAQFPHHVRGHPACA
jgi:hypothetical protein